MNFLHPSSQNINFTALKWGKTCEFSLVLSIAKSVGQNIKNDRQNIGTHKWKLNFCVLVAFFKSNIWISSRLKAPFWAGKGVSEMKNISLIQLFFTFIPKIWKNVIFSLLFSSFRWEKFTPPPSFTQKIHQCFGYFQ